MISRENYMEWFVDFSDGKLNPSQKQHLLDFLSENEDLKQEFQEWTSLSADEISFSHDTVQNEFDTRHLIKSIITVDVINEHNYQDIFIAYHEGDLNNDEQKSLFLFLQKNACLQKEFEIFAMTKLTADETLVMPESDLPYKRATALPLFRWISYAAAASVLLIVLYFIRPEKLEEPYNNDNRIVKNEIEIPNITNEDSIIDESDLNPSLVIENKQKPKATISPKNQNINILERENVSDIIEFNSYESVVVLETKLLIPDMPNGKKRLEGFNTYEPLVYNEPNSGFLTPTEWLRSVTIEKITGRKSKKLIEREDIKPIVAFASNEILGVSYELEKKENGRNKFQFTIGNFSVERK